MDQPIVIPLRRCTKCGREFPATTEFFHVAYGSTLRGDCRDCRNAASRAKWVNDDHHRQRVSEWYAKNPGKRAAHVRKYHTSAKGQEAYARKYNRG